MATDKLAVANLMREKHRTALASSSLTSDLTGKACAPTTVQWVTDTFVQGNITVRALIERNLKTWYFLVVDYALGQALERDATAALAASGGEAVGAVRSPLGTTEFSSPLLSAQASCASVLALASTGADMINAIKQAGEFGITPQMTIAPLFIQLSDVQALGLPVAKGLRFVEAFYWDLNDKTRAWSRRFSARMEGRMPTEDHAGTYSATLAYLRAVRDASTIEGEKVVERMKILVSHVREYAEREGIYLGSGTMSETVVMSLEDVRRAMGTGSTAPPPSVAELIAEAQGLSPESEHPAPPSRPTLPDLE